MEVTVLHSSDLPFTAVKALKPSLEIRARKHTLYIYSMYPQRIKKGILVFSTDT